MKPVVKLFTYVSLTIITMVMFWSIFDKLFGDTVGLLFAFTLTPITAYLVYLIANKISLQPKPNYMVFSLIVTLVICLIATIIPKSQGLPYAEMAIKHIKNSPEEMNEYYDYINRYNDKVEDLKKAIRFEIVEKFGIILDTEISEDLKKERLSREIVSIIQQKRKSDGYEITDRVKVEVISDEEIIKSSISDFNEYIKNETLATDLVFINKVGNEKVLDYNFSVELQNSTNKS